MEALEGGSIRRAWEDTWGRQRENTSNTVVDILDILDMMNILDIMDMRDILGSYSIPTSFMGQYFVCIEFK